MHCPFCEIDSKKTKVIQENQRTYVAFSNPRLVPGHLLVIPKRHVEKLSELTEDELHELWSAVIDFQERILSQLTPGCDIRQNYRPFQKQSRLKVDHLHIHLIPRRLKDELYNETQSHGKYLFKDLDEKELKQISSLLINQNTIIK